MLSELKSFFESGPLSQQAAASIKDNREIAIFVDTVQNGKLGFTFTKENGKNLLKEGTDGKADLVFNMHENIARELVTRNFDSVGQVGLYLFEKILSKEPSQKVTAKLNVGVLSLMTGGYLGVLSAGGSDVAKFLASKGLGNMGKIKDALSKLRG